MPQSPPRAIRDTPLHVEIAGNTLLPPNNGPPLVFVAGNVFLPFAPALADPSMTLGNLIGIENFILAA